MSRAVTEWIATHDDQAIPRLVKARVWARCEGRCALTGKKLTAADHPEFDHIKPLADGGEHRETNLQLVGGEAHKAKTAAEAPQRAKERRIHAKHFGYWPAPKVKLQGRGFGQGRNRSSRDAEDTRDASKREAHAQPNPNNRNNRTP